MKPNPPVHLTPNAYLRKYQETCEAEPKFLTWYYELFGIPPRAFVNDGQCWTMTDNPKVLAHEWLHIYTEDAEFEHLPWWRFDIASHVPLRIFDEYDLMAESAEWRDSLIEGCL